MAGFNPSRGQGRLPDLWSRISPQTERNPVHAPEFLVGHWNRFWALKVMGLGRIAPPKRHCTPAF